jgi:Stage II sporulation protein E (SpoIIE)
MIRGPVPIAKEVTNGYPTRVGSRGGFAAVLAALATLAFACPAWAQLPVKVPAQLPSVELPLQDGAVGDALHSQVVEEALNEPLPAPVEEVVSESPVAPVREEVRRVVGDTTEGGGGNGGGGTGGGSIGTSASGAAQPDTSSGSSGQGGLPGTSPNDSSDGSGTRRGNTRRGDPRPGSTRRGRAGARRAARVPPGPGAGARRGDRSRGDARPTTSGADDDGNPIARTVEKLVHVVPRIVWLALGVLLVAAIALGARAFVERRRARALRADRERLLSEVGLLERALLPEVPAQLGALATSVAYRPCEGPAAGGDFYDAFELPGGRAAILVGDVAGHGQEALERTNSIRTALHACLEAGMSPRAALASIGQRAAVESSGRFTTVVVAVHDPAAGTLTYSAAGHPPPILTGPSPYEPITVASSPPIGVGARTGMRETSVPLPAGSVACLFTDGLLEARVADGLFGRERLTAMVAELSPDEQADALLEFVIATADEASDDMAVFILRPLSGAELLAPRVETVELEADDLDLGLGERFLNACEVPTEEAAIALEHAHATAASAGGALIEVTIDDRGARARVSGPEATATPAAA